MAVFDFLKEKRAQSEKNAPGGEGRKLISLPVAHILPNPNQPRKSFHDEGLMELARSIGQVGLIQPPIVRKSSAGGYELVAGERRLRACKILGMEEIPCLLEETLPENESAVIALIENLQRENLHYLEEAECYASLLTRYGLTQEQLAERLGKSQSAVANKLRILRLSLPVKEAMTGAGMTERHARALLRLGNEQTQLSVVERVREKALSVKETERLVEKTIARAAEKKKAGTPARPKVLRALRDFRLFINSVSMAAGQLRDAGLLVEMEQKDLPDGLDILIRVRRKEK